MKAHGGCGCKGAHTYVAYTQPRHLEKVGWLVLRSAAFTPRYSFYSRLSDPRSSSGYETVKKTSTPPTPGIETGPSSP